MERISCTWRGASLILATSAVQRCCYLMIRYGNPILVRRVPSFSFVKLCRGCANQAERTGEFGTKLRKELNKKQRKYVFLLFTTLIFGFIARLECFVPKVYLLQLCIYQWISVILIEIWNAPDCFPRLQIGVSFTIFCN